MTPSNTRRELLIFKSTSFARRQFGTTEQTEMEPGIANMQTDEKLNRQAEILSSLFQATNKDEITKARIFIWQVDKYSSFVHLSAGESPLCTDKYASIDPHFFWQTINLS